MDPTHSQSNGIKKTKRRIRNWTAEDRAAHRVFEKSRREAFNGRILVGLGRKPPFNGDS